MKIIIDGNPKEIAALVVALQERRENCTAPSETIRKEVGWAVHGPQCGRGASGKFHCFCGECKQS